MASALNIASSPVPSLAEVSKNMTSSPRFSVTSDSPTFSSFKSALFPQITAGTLAGCFNLSNFALAALISSRSSQTSLKDSLSSKLNTSRKMSPEKRRREY